MTGETPAQRVFGEIPGNPVGTTYSNRDDLAAAGVHKPKQAGISGSEREGADSIVLSGGYEDDIDNGEVIVYTGEGGRDSHTGRQIDDQTFTGHNQALARSCIEGLPVRVVRGARAESPYGPASGYRYDGLYYVEQFWSERGKSGRVVCRFRLQRAESQPIPWTKGDRYTEEAAPRVATTVQRIVRSTENSRRVKELYNYSCQVCGIRIETAGGPYAEGAHIRPLGDPHNGPDVIPNILCLCPNHHVMLDHGVFSIADDFTLTGVPGRLRVAREHEISLDSLRYHRQHVARRHGRT